MSLVSRYLDPAVIERLKQLQLSARSVVEGNTTGLHKSPVKGASIEFRQHRFYVPGDEPRRLDWRVLARTNKPFIKEYDEETNLRCVLMLDSSGSMAYGDRAGSKFDYAARMAASLAYLMLGQTESVGLAAHSNKVDTFIAPHGGHAQLTRIIDALERISPRQDSSLHRAMHEVADRVSRRALMVILSDFFVPAARIREGLARLRHDRHEVIAMQILHRNEVDFPFRSWSRFKGLEGERAQLCETALVRKTYLENFRRHRRELEESCRVLGVEFASFVTDDPLIESMTSFLRRRRTIG
jgi:uncharacterized protein (DUF58 family)